MTRSAWGRHSMTVSSLLSYCLATPSATFFRLPARKCSTTAETTYEAGPSSSTLIAAWCVLQTAVVGHNDRELWFFVGLSVMWIVCGSGSQAVAAPISETRVGELMCGLLRCIRAIHQARHSTAQNQTFSAALSTSRLAEGSDRWYLEHPNLPKRATCESPLSHPFPVFISSSSGVFVTLPPSRFPRLSLVWC